ncbi:MAG: sn-glycerol-3-phosphate ABC transporter ATP-binding protein UgpC [Betaproteobacteria bacterium]|nr:sn-glycerol-3-phosphate ABC transporter ATP-binding protein UgpC [Betaproteobacteria bacterium]MBK6601667.1 sn-glycerol-3-phosphate ABC transporter ATP-binding protein UgpC [Betaproteobacteria bacterium]MBK7593591.1 sn-glycerol-3-phosphate ABC transporter ATP-binding protein UgpC [Betaproteobacteria bacterium]MBK7744301.1 sn-glycerol-3-phosphate ABC transporter ATP-binding protein UgpC [Betaproteobacteria bacterium]MBK8689907.1 sn-glycerol-3-phosphate ABC transporter ATP-binding protein UgpC
MATVSLRQVRKTYDAQEIVHGVDLEVADQEFVVLVGPSGCGKSTLLRMIAGLEEISGGEIAIGERTVNEVDPKDRDVAMVFQDYALYPHLTVFQNIAFSLQYRNVGKAEIARRVAEVAAILDIEPLLERKPRQLSGGQRQRVAMGRAIVREPKVFLFDEPLSNLDAKLRVQMRTEIKKLRERVRTTAIYVTHDQVEAMTLADRIVLMHNGQVEQIGTPEDVYDEPATLFVAGFVGTSAMNLIQGRIEGGAVIFGDGARLVLPPSRYDAHAGKAVTIGLRPEHLHWAKDGDPNPLVGVARVVEPLGSDTLVVFDVAGCELQARLPPRVVRHAGEAVRVAVAPESIHLFDPATERRL